MKELARLAVTLLVLWLPFSIAAVVCIPVGLVAIFVEPEYAKNILRAQDKAMAALLGWTGRYTVSAECGASKEPCRFCRWVCWFLDLIDPGHCPGAAKREGLVK